MPPLRSGARRRLSAMYRALAEQGLSTEEAAGLMTDFVAGLAARSVATRGH